jgi:hypothetical protein
MNRVQLVQVIVIIVAMLLGYQVIYCLDVFLAQAIASVAGGNNDFSQAYILSYAVMAILFAISMFILLNNASKISSWVIDKVQPDETVELTFSDKSILYAILLFLTLSSLFKNIPAILYQLFELFKRSAGASYNEVGNSYGQANYPQWIETIIAFILLINSRAVVNYFHAKINPEDPYAINRQDEIGTPT